MLQSLLQNPTRLALLGLVVFSFLGFVVYSITVATKPDMALLFSQVDPSDGGRIIERLKARGIQFEIVNSHDIYALSEEVAKLRMELAEEGLPSGGTVGYEIFDKSDLLGTTASMLDLNYVRALEGEVGKSIRTIQGVQGARVHLVLPKRELFSQNRTEPSASVVIRMKGSSRLSADQVRAIQHLIASSVPNLLIDRVSIVDDRGTLLARGQNEANGVGGGQGMAHHDDYRQQQEERMARSIEGMLEKILGSNKSRAEVALDMDFDQITTTSVDFDPERQVVRNITNSKESSSGGGGQTDAVTIQNSLPDQQSSSTSGGVKNQNQREEENMQYEIANTNKTHIKEPGGLKKLSVAVLVDGVTTKDKDGKVDYKPRTSEEIEKITKLIKTAVGFDHDRGDVVEVVNMPFSEAEALVDIQPSAMSQIFSYVNPHKLIELSLLGLFIFLTGFFVVRPVVMMLVSSFGANAVSLAEKYENSALPISGSNTSSMNASGFDISVAPQATQPQSSVERFQNLSEQTGQIVEGRPDESVELLRGWMQESRGRR